MDFNNGVKKDAVYTWDPIAAAYTEYVHTATSWPTDPVQADVGGGLWYFNAQATNNFWTESFSVNQ
jgi:hypothetical protein